MRVWPGRPYPLGATWDGAGVNFALFSENADRSSSACSTRLGDDTETRAHRACRADRPGLARLPARCPARPTLRLSRPWALRAGERASLQSATRSCSIRTPRRSAATCGGTTRSSATRSAQDDLSFDERDSAAFAPLAAVIDPAFTWGDDRRRARRGTRRSSTSCTSRASRKLHPGVPEKLRGTYAGLASEAAIDHLTQLGVTAVELLPVHHYPRRPASRSNAG